VFAAILVYAVMMAAVSSAAEVKFVEPAGFGKAKFGMSAAQVTKLYPKLRQEKAIESPTGEAPPMAVYYLDDQRVGTLKQCKVELRFFKDELYEFQFRCPERAKVGDYLKKTYGLPTKSTETAVFWMGKQSAVGFSPPSGAFAYSDLARSQAMQALFYKAMIKAAQEGEQPAAAGATPGAAAPPAQAPPPTAGAPDAPPPAGGAPAAPPHE